MSRISAIVEEADREIGAIAKEYGVHGEPVRFSSGTLQITRRGERWGVFLVDEKAEPENITGARLEVKLDFLSKRRDIETDYRKRIADLHDRIGHTISKHG
jgi:hypothetical protein